MTPGSGCWVTKIHEAVFTGDVAVFTGDVTGIVERTGFFSNLGCYTKQGQKKRTLLWMSCEVLYEVLHQTICHV